MKNNNECNEHVVILKGIIDEDFVNYKVPSMFIAFPKCSFKCEKEDACFNCQNKSLIEEKNIFVAASSIIKRYINNRITSAIVFGGLEPFDSGIDLLRLIYEFREVTNDDIVIYSGYTKEELENNPYYKCIKTEYKNIIVKFGRCKSNSQSILDPVLNVILASDNQFAEKIS